MAQVDSMAVAVEKLDAASEASALELGFLKTEIKAAAGNVSSVFAEMKKVKEHVEEDLIEAVKKV
eukprot:8982661-Pyramimonas_sp.AAC.3